VTTPARLLVIDEGLGTRWKAERLGGLPAKPGVRRRFKQKIARRRRAKAEGRRRAREAATPRFL
jgi:hypothetical protein